MAANEISEGHEGALKDIEFLQSQLLHTVIGDINFSKLVVSNMLSGNVYDHHDTQFPVIDITFLQVSSHSQLMLHHILPLPH